MAFICQMYCYVNIDIQAVSKLDVSILTFCVAISLLAPRLLVNKAVKPDINVALINNQIMPIRRPIILFGVLSPYLKEFENRITNTCEQMDTSIC